MWKPEANIKTLPTRLPQWRNRRKKHNIQGDIRTLLGNENEVLGNEDEDDEVA